MAVPLLQSLVLAPGPDSKRWAAALLTAAQQQTAPWRVAPSQSTHASSNLEGLCCQGELAVVQSARRLLNDLWPAAGQASAAVKTTLVTPAAAATDASVEAAVAWLQSLAASITHCREAAAAAGGSSSALTVALPSARQLREQEEAGEGGEGASVELGPGAAALLGALLMHRDARVVAAAAVCLRQLVLAVPATAPVFLPPLLMQLQRLSVTGSSKQKGSGAHALLVARAAAALLSVLPCMTSDPTTAAFAMRALQPLTDQAAPAALRGLALRLTVDGWRTTGRWVWVGEGGEGLSPTI